MKNGNWGKALKQVNWELVIVIVAYLGCMCLFMAAVWRYGSAGVR